MQTARSLTIGGGGVCLGGVCPGVSTHGGVCPGGVCHPPPREQNHRQLWKHNLPATSFAGGNYGQWEPHIPSRK